MDILKLLGQHVGQLNNYLASPEQKGKLLGWTPAQTQNLAIGGMMGTGDWSAANAAVDALTSRPMGGADLPTRAFNKMQPQVPTIEQTIEKSSGWNQPGLRQNFDTALFTKDANQVRTLLPQIPTEYRLRFGQEIAKLLGGG